MFASIRIISAYSSAGSFFGGRILQAKAKKIQEAESNGFTCSMLGTSISIKPLGSNASTPTDFFIPSYLMPQTRTSVRSNQLILGRYSGEETIKCTKEGDPPEEREVVLEKLNLYGTSR